MIVFTNFKDHNNDRNKEVMKSLKEKLKNKATFVSSDHLFLLINECLKDKKMLKILNKTSSKEEDIMYKRFVEFDFILNQLKGHYKEDKLLIIDYSWTDIVSLCNDKSSNTIENMFYNYSVYMRNYFNNINESVLKSIVKDNLHFNVSTIYFETENSIMNDYFSLDKVYKSIIIGELKKCIHRKNSMTESYIFNENLIYIDKHSDINIDKIISKLTKR